MNSTAVDADVWGVFAVNSFTTVQSGFLCIISGFKLDFQPKLVRAS